MSLLVVLAVGLPTSASASVVAPWTPLGLGGEGGMFAQAISPIDPKLMMVTCDMGASYVTRDGGVSWEIIDWRQLGSMGGGGACPPVFHPTDVNTIYAYGQKNYGTPSLLVTRDKGSTWSVLSSPWGGTQITALYQDRGNTNLMLAGVNNAVYWSANEGATWTLASGASGAAAKFFIDWRSPVASRICYVGGSGGVFRSTDSGRNWSAFNAGLGSTNLRSFTGGANASTLSLFATDVNYVTWRSVDGGAWTNVTGVVASRQPWQVATSEVNPDIVYVTANNGAFEDWTNYQNPPTFQNTTTMLWKSVDRGVTWNPACYQFHVGSGNVEWTWETFDRPAQRWDDGTLVRNFMVSQTDPACAIAGDWARCLTTRDGGATWKQMTSTYADSGAPAAGKRWKTSGLSVTNAFTYSISPHNANFHYIGLADIALLRSEDAGQTWIYSAVGDPWPNTVYQLAYDPDLLGTMYGAASDQHDISMWGGNAGPTLDGGVIKSTDYGRTWTAASNGLPVAGSKLPTVSVVVSPVDKSLYCAVYGGWIYRSTDKAASWTQCACSGLFAGTVNNHNLWKLIAHADGTLFAIVEGKLVQGASWDFPDPGAVFRSSDRGATWTNITTNVTGGKPLYNPQGFDVDPGNSAIIYIAASNGKYPNDTQWGLYKTVNGGSTWTKFAMPFSDSFSNSVKIDPANTNAVYFMSTANMYVTGDAGATWAEACPWAPYSNYFYFSLYHPSYTIYMATMGVSALKGTLTPLSLGAVAVTGVTGSGATITWTTNVPADTQVDYGTSTAYGSTTTLAPVRVTSHTVTLSGLTAGTTYHIRARSIDGSGAVGLSGDVVFFTTTASADTTPPVISAVAASAITASSATISWTTNEASDSQVE
ncbi:MAG: hypothetical protein H0W83_15415, partial [Planctomycetes bacterium]|nr:hypothetical protein [Planctomycetota bacterium]